MLDFAAFDRFVVACWQKTPSIAEGRFDRVCFFLVFILRPSPPPSFCRPPLAPRQASLVQSFSLMFSLSFAKFYKGEGAREFESHRRRQYEGPYGRRVSKRSRGGW